MALLEGRNSNTSKKLRRTNNRLVISTDSQTPNEEYIVNMRLDTTAGAGYKAKTQFSDIFGAPNLGLDGSGAVVGATVLIGKGRVVSGFKGLPKKGKFGPTVLTITEKSGNTAYAGHGPYYPLGIAPFNIYKLEDDKQTGNQPNVLVRDVMIELPLVNVVGDADAIQTGVAYGSFTIGGYVESDDWGRIVPYTSGNIANVVGKVFAIKEDLPLAAWLQWLTLPENLLADEGIMDDNYPALTPDAYNPVTQGDNYPRSAAYVDRPFQYEDARGISYLTDGSLFGGVTYTNEACVDNTGANKTTPAALAVDDQVTFWVQHAPIKSGTITILVDQGGGNLDITANCSIDYTSGKIVWTVAAGQDGAGYENKAVSATYNRGPNVPGMTRNWDVAGGLGAIHIFLGI